MQLPGTSSSPGGPSFTASSSGAGLSCGNASGSWGPNSRALRWYSSVGGKKGRRKRRRIYPPSLNTSTTPTQPLETNGKKKKNLFSLHLLVSSAFTPSLFTDCFLICLFVRRRRAGSDRCRAATAASKARRGRGMRGAGGTGVRTGGGRAGEGRKGRESTPTRFSPPGWDWEGRGRSRGAESVW